MCDRAQAVPMSEANAARSGRWTAVNRWGIRAAYLALVVWFGLVLVRFHDPEDGFNRLIMFGAKQGLPQLSDFKRLNFLLMHDGYGYDAQYYAQIAMHPDLKDPELKTAVDSLAYRSRRILFGWTAYALGWGDPARILAVYVLQNAIAWVILAWLLLHWLPPVSWTNFFRWGGVLFCAGLCMSLRNALLDGPSLMLIALGVWLLDRNRKWLGIGVLALSGLAKETNLITGTALIKPEDRSWRALGRLALLAVLLAVPLALWLIYIRVTVGSALDAGVRNFDWPLRAYFATWKDAYEVMYRPYWFKMGQTVMVMMVALTTQMLFFLLRWRPKEIWWRVGVSFAVLMVVLGPAVWEGYPGAAVRVLLPMQLAFNILVPRTRAWWLVLILGNVSALYSVNFLRPPAGSGYRVEGPAAVRTSEDGREKVRVDFGPGWFDTEESSSSYWRWVPADTGFTIINPRQTSIKVRLSFYLGSVDHRMAKVLLGEKELWSGPTETQQKIELPVLELPPGRTAFQIKTDRPPQVPTVPPGSTQVLAFALRNLRLQVEP